MVSHPNIAEEKRIFIYPDLIEVYITGKHSYRYFGPYIWSRLDRKIKDKPTLQ